MPKKPGEANVADTASQMARTVTSCEAIEVTLVEEAAQTINDLSRSTGMSVEELIETSITVLKIIAESAKIERRVVVTTKFLVPIKELVLPAL
jgi:sialic acid synthase SpsE